MIMAHLPAGYIVANLAWRLMKSRENIRNRLIAAGMAGAIAPDLDMLYFYLLDHRRHHHHTYWSHFPLLWICLLLVAAIGFRAKSGGALAALMVVFSLNGLIHLFLDSVAGDILWFAPFGDAAYALFTVPARYDPWWLNFLLHWSSLFEIAVIVGAVYAWRARRGVA